MLGVADPRGRVVGERRRRLAAQGGHDAGEDDDDAVAAGVDDARLAQDRQQLGPAAHRRLAGDDRLLEDVGQHALLLVALGVRPEPRRVVRQARRDVRGHVAHDGQHRALGRRADRCIGALRRTRHGGAQEHRIDELAGARDELLGRTADELGEDDAAVAARPSSAARARTRRSPRGGSRRAAGRPGPAGRPPPGTPEGSAPCCRPCRRRRPGSTLRSLISWRRDSRWASAPSSAMRKRTRLGSDTRRRRSKRLRDLAGLEAARADVDAPWGLAHEDPHLLQVRIEAPLRGHHRVASAVAECRASTAAVTDLRHGTAQCSGPMGRVACRGMPVSEHRIALPARYRVVRHIANGGMASVWAAEDELLGRLVAVKVLVRRLRPGRARQPPLPARGARRRPPLGVPPRRHRLRHRRARRPPVHGHGALRGRHGGRPPAQRPRRSRARWRCAGCARPPRRWTARTATTSCTATSSPPTCSSTSAGAWRSGDFGIATVATEASLTQTGQVLGTAAYISPEQARGHAATDASDRYALAVVAFELLTGRRPFTADHPAAQARAHVEDSVPSASAAGIGLPARGRPRAERGHGEGPRASARRRPRTSWTPSRTPSTASPPPAGPPTAVTAPVARAAAPAHAPGPVAPRRPQAPLARPGRAGRARARGRRRHRHRRRDRRRATEVAPPPAPSTRHGAAQRVQGQDEPRPQTQPRPRRSRPRPRRRRRRRRRRTSHAGRPPPGRRPSPTTRSPSTTRASRSSARASRPTPSRRCSARSRPSAPRTARATSATPTRSTTWATPCA